MDTFCINTQFNYPREITPESKKVCDNLTCAGVIAGNQVVVLRGVIYVPDSYSKTPILPQYILNKTMNV